MALLRTIACDLPGCDGHLTEPSAGEGHAGWISIYGIALNGNANPSFCPEHKEQIMNFIDSLIPDEYKSEE